MIATAKLRRRAGQRISSALWGLLVMGAGGLMIATLSGYDIDLQLIAIIVLGALGAWLLLSAALSGIGRQKQVAKATAPVVEEPASKDQPRAASGTEKPAPSPKENAPKPAGAQAFADTGSTDKAPASKATEDKATNDKAPDATLAATKPLNTTVADTKPLETQPALTTPAAAKESLKPDAVTKRPARTTTSAKNKPASKKPATKKPANKKPTDSDAAKD